YSDMTIECGWEPFFVHQCIVCPQCEYFEQFCSRGLYHNFLSENELLVAKMVGYLYTGDYTVENDSWNERPTKPNDPTAYLMAVPDVTTSIGHLTFHLKMLALAEKLYIPGLMKTAEHHVVKALNGMRSKDSFRNAIREIYSAPFEYMYIIRSVAVDYPIANMKKLRSAGCTGSEKALDNTFLREFPEFSNDLLLEMVDQF
ncbi:hypothetical protein BGW36DRAFT_306715, partial [Talaromyces proteolyticus]